MKELVDHNHNRCAIVAWHSSGDKADFMEECIEKNGRVNLLLERRITNKEDLEAYAKRQAQSLLAFAATGVVCFIAENSANGDDATHVESESFNSVHELEEFVSSHTKA